VKTAPERRSVEESEAQKDQSKRQGALRFLGELPALVILAFVIALVVKTFFLQAFYIPSQSMEPTLEVGDRVLVQKISYYLHDPRRGEIIVFENPHETREPDRGLVGGFFHWMFQGLGVQHPDNVDFIKRVIGLPGDTVWAKDGSVYVNGRKLSEPYLTQKTGDFRRTAVPAGDLFVMGDNRANSDDSRYNLGFVPESKVIGRAWVIIWPAGRMSLLH
jgi:signal peptidase I